RARHPQPRPVRQVAAPRGAPPVRRLDAADREPLRRGHQPLARALVPPGLVGAGAPGGRRAPRRDRHPPLLGARAGRDAAAGALLFRAKPRCTASLMAACKRLKVVGRHGVGLDTVDIPAATKLGVAVVHAPGSNSQSVAEHALMLMLMSAKRARQVDAWTRQ